MSAVKLLTFFIIIRKLKSCEHKLIIKVITNWLLDSTPRQDFLLLRTVGHTWLRLIFSLISTYCKPRENSVFVAITPVTYNLVAEFVLSWSLILLFFFSFYYIYCPCMICFNLSYIYTLILCKKKKFYLFFEYDFFFLSI